MECSTAFFTACNLVPHYDPRVGYFPHKLRSVGWSRIFRSRTVTAQPIPVPVEEVEIQHDGAKDQPGLDEKTFGVQLLPGEQDHLRRSNLLTWQLLDVPQELHLVRLYTHQHLQRRDRNAVVRGARSRRWKHWERSRMGRGRQNGGIIARKRK